MTAQLQDPTARLATLPTAQRGISRRQAAAILGFSARHVADLMASGDLARFDGACSGAKRPRWFTTRRSVEEFLARRTIQGKQHDDVRGEVVLVRSGGPGHE